MAGILSRRYVVLYAVVLCVFLLGTLACIRYSVERSDAYQVASQYVRSSDKVSLAVGTVKVVRLSWLDEMSFEESESNNAAHGEASFVLIVEGIKSRSLFRARLEKDAQGAWEVADLKQPQALQ